LCLQTTSIQTIESTFIPPDIDLDMYDFDMYDDNEADNEWKEFLNEFMLPLAGQSDEIDDDADPEYVAEPMPVVDKEELKSVRVSKKELNQLISELLEDSCSAMFDNEPLAKRGESSTTMNAKHQAKTTPQSKIKSQLHSPKASTKIVPRINELNTPPHTVEIPKIVETTPEPLAQAPQHQYYSPMQLQTPQRPGYFTPTAYQSPSTSLNSSIVLSPPQLQHQQIINQDISPSASILVINQNQLEIRSLADSNGAFNSNSIISQGFYSNGFYTLPQFQTVVVQVPTIDLLQNGLNFTSPIAKSSVVNTSENAIEPPPIQPNITDDTKQLLRRESKLKTFDYLNYEQPPTAMKFVQNAKGFTCEQRHVFEEQFRMHCQMSAQNFLQFYAHPKFYNLAESQKSHLLELERVCPKNNITHHSECTKLCNRWERDLAENSEKNQKYIGFLHEEVELDEESFKERKFFKGRFHNRMMEAMLQSSAIIYLSLIPKIPFRAVKFSKIDPTKSELLMIALGMEHANDKIYQELNSKNPIRLREPKITSIASEVVRIFNSFRGHKGMLKIIESYKSHKLMNPIKFYFQHKRAPAVRCGEMETVQLENVQPPMNLRRGVLPKLWEAYKFSHERVGFQISVCPVMLNTLAHLFTI
jgi:hypothetical protein